MAAAVILFLLQPVGFFNVILLWWRTTTSHHSQYIYQLVPLQRRCKQWRREPSANLKVDKTHALRPSAISRPINLFWNVPPFERLQLWQLRKVRTGRKGRLQLMKRNTEEERRTAAGQGETQEVRPTNARLFYIQLSRYNDTRKLKHAARQLYIQHQLMRWRM